MLKGLRKEKRRSKKVDRASGLLNVELSEIEELSSLMMSRIDARLRTLRETEERLEGKMEALERLLLRAEKVTQEPDGLLDYRYREVLVLASKGLKTEEIAGILDISRGEVEFIITMNMHSERM